MRNTTKYLAAGGTFDYEAVATSAYKTQAFNQTPKHVQEGICFTLSAFWLQCKIDGNLPAASIFAEMEKRLGYFANTHRIMQIPRSAAANGAVLTNVQSKVIDNANLFSDFRLNLHDKKEYTTNATVPSINNDPQNTTADWADLNANRDDVWTATGNGQLDDG